MGCPIIYTDTIRYPEIGNANFKCTVKFFHNSRLIRQIEQKKLQLN